MYCNADELSILFIDHKPIYHSFSKKDLFDYILNKYSPLKTYSLKDSVINNDKFIKTYQDLSDYIYLSSGIIKPIINMKDKKGKNFEFSILTSLFYIDGLKADPFYSRKMIRELKDYLMINQIEYNFDDRV